MDQDRFKRLSEAYHILQDESVRYVVRSPLTTAESYNLYFDKYYHDVAADKNQSSEKRAVTS